MWARFLAYSDGGYGIGVDGGGGVYVTGYSHATWGTPLNPHGGPHYDVFVARLNGSDGVRQWNTFLGFSTTSRGRDIVVDRFGSVYVVGDTKDAGAEVFNGAFLTRLDGDGSWQWNEFIGKTYDHDYGRGVVSPSLPPGKFIDDTATITATAVDGNPGNNTNSVGVMIPSAYTYLPLVVRD